MVPMQVSILSIVVPCRQLWMQVSKAFLPLDFHYVIIVSMPTFQHQRYMPERSYGYSFVSDAGLQVAQCQYTGTSNV